MALLKSEEGKPHRFADPTPGVSEPATAREIGPVSGRRIVIAIYVGLTAFSGVMGYVLGIVVGDLGSVALFGMISVPPTPLGLAVYGAVTIGTLLGVLLLLVRVAASFDE